MDLNVVNLCTIFLDSLEKGDKPRDAWASQERGFPELWEHYFDFWFDRDKSEEAISAAAKNISRGTYDLRIRSINALIPPVGRMLDKIFGLELPTIVLIFGLARTKGHAFRTNNKTYVWFDVRQLENEKWRNVNIPHELVHGIHYQANPNMAFENNGDRSDYARLLMCEGLATYISMKLNKLTPPEIVWANHRPSNEIEAWTDRYTNNRGKLLRHLLDNIDALKSETNVFGIFGDEIWSSRAATMLGLEFVEHLAAEHEPKKLVLMDRKTVVSHFTEYAKKHLELEK